MHIQQIITEQTNIENAEALKNAFDENEWINIEHALLQRYVDTLGQGYLTGGSSDHVIRNYYNNIKNKIGSGIPINYTTGQWQTFAQRFQVGHPSGRPSWNDIHSYLSQYATQQPSEELRNITSQQSSRAVARANNATPESKAQILQQLSGQATFESISEASAYMREFLDIVSQIGNRNIQDSEGLTWRDYVRRELTSQTRIQALWRNVLAQHVTNRGTEAEPDWQLSAPLNRTTLNDSLWGWLLVTDNRIRQTRWNNEISVPNE